MEFGHAREAAAAAFEQAGAFRGCVYFEERQGQIVEKIGIPGIQRNRARSAK